MSESTNLNVNNNAMPMNIRINQSFNIDETLNVNLINQLQLHGCQCGKQR